LLGNVAAEGKDTREDERGAKGKPRKEKVFGGKRRGAPGAQKAQEKAAERKGLKGSRGRIVGRPVARAGS